MPPTTTHAQYAAAYAAVPRLAETLTPIAIAKQLGVSAHTVRRWMDAHGIARRTHRVHTAPTVRQAIDAVRAGQSMSAVASAMDLDLATVQYWCRRAGVRSVYHKTTRRLIRCG